MQNVIEMTHPLIQHKITMMRDSQTKKREFRCLVNEVSTLMWYEVTKDLPLKEITLDTPLRTTRSKVISGKHLSLIPLLRSGIAMAESIEELMPALKVGHIGIYRDPKTLLPNTYYCKLPEGIENSEAIVLEPMLATGGSVSGAIDILKEHGVKSVKVMSLLAAPEGIDFVIKNHPEVTIFAGAIDSGLDENGFIVPGFGDAGDRMFGTV